MVKVSIIIPVYNAGVYLDACIQSILRQTLHDIEVICVCDCPTDGSDVICEKYSKLDARVRVIHNTNNLHIGLSRNVGLKEAKGKYLAFCDHDDYCTPEMYETLYNFAEEGKYDIVLGVRAHDDNGTVTVFDYPTSFNTSLREFTLKDLLACGGPLSDYPFAINVHPNLYLRSVIETYDLKFVDTRKIVPEDRLWNIYFLTYSKKVALVRTPLYFHRILSSSEGHNSSYLDLTKRLRFLESIYSWCKDTKIFDDYQQCFVGGASKMLYSIIVGSIASNPFKLWSLIYKLRGKVWVVDALRYSPSRWDKSMLKRSLRFFLLKLL